MLGLGAGHGGGAEAFGYAADKPVTRYLEALEIIVPLLRGAPTSTFDGEFHRVKDAVLRPRGPRPGGIPLMMGGHSEGTIDCGSQVRRRLERIRNVEQPA